MNTGKLYLDREGFEKLCNEIKELERKIKNLGSDIEARSEKDMTENAVFEDLKIQKMLLQFQLKERREELERVVILEKKKEDGIVNIGSIVKVDIVSNNIGETCDVKLVGSLNPKTEIMEVSINSPLGKAIFEKKVNDVVSYNVEGVDFRVRIIGIKEEKNLKNEPKKEKCFELKKEY